MAMSKKTWIIIGAVLLVIVAAISGIYLASKYKKSTSESPASFFPVTNPFVAKDEDVPYNDESGFSFQYPKSLKIEDVTPDDNSYYSVLALSKGGQSIKITVKDTTDKKINVEGELLGALTLDSVSAKQYQSGTNLVTAALDQGVLYTIEGPKDGGYWEEAQNKIVSTFKFGKQEVVAPEISNSDNTSYEEEVVE
ncbi:MAG: hypothetical protein AAB656_02980 [Patescibacteria group bacterium]